MGCLENKLVEGSWVAGKETKQTAQNKMGDVGSPTKLLGTFFVCSDYNFEFQSYHEFMTLRVCQGRHSIRVSHSTLFCCIFARTRIASAYVPTSSCVPAA